MSNLKPCPCCGKEPLATVQIVSEGAWLVFVVCCQLKCGLRGPPRYTESEAIDAWNQRPGDKE